MADSKTDGVGPAIAGGLAHAGKGLVSAMGKQLLSSASGRMGGVAERLTDFTSNGGGVKGLVSAVKGGGSGGGGGKNSGKSLKVTNIVEQIDVGVPVRLAYDQWTQFSDFPSFMKKVETVEQQEDEKLHWKAQILWSHRDWDSTITEQVPDRRIVWESEGAKGYVNGAVTFHELAPELTRICVILEYYPQGFFERTGNLWRAQGRRARLELKHFARHVMTEAVLHPDEVQGWRGEIHDGEVVKDDEQARQEEEQQNEGAERPPEDKDEDRDEGRDEDRDQDQDEDRDEGRDERKDASARRREPPPRRGGDRGTRRPRGENERAERPGRRPSRSREEAR